MISFILTKTRIYAFVKQKQYFPLIKKEFNYLQIYDL